MRKITELDATTRCEPNVFPWRISFGKQHIQSKWLELVLSIPQQEFAKQHRLTFRPHPKNATVIEVFVDERDIAEHEWSMIHLIF